MNIILPCIVGLVLAQTVPADDAGLPAKVQRLMKQLDAAELESRQAAEKALTELGPDILPLIRPAIDDTNRSEEVRHRLAQVQQDLQRAAAQRQAEGQTVTLQADAMPLLDVLAAFEKQTGNKITDLRPRFGQEAANPKLKFDFAKTPYWKALDDVLDQAKLTIYPYSGQEGVAIVNRPQNDPPRSGRATYAGPFRIEAMKLGAERDLRDPKQGAIRVLFEVAWEPRLSPLSVHLPMDQLKATDDRGQALARAGEGGREILVTPRATAVALEAPFALPPRDAKSITSLKGTVTVALLGPVEEFTFDKLDDGRNAKKQSQRKGDVTVTLDQIRKNNDLWEIRVQVSLADAATKIDSHANWIARNEAVLFDANKKAIPAATTEAVQESRTSVGMAYLYDGPESLKGCTLVYKSPTAPLTIPVPFELNNLELP